MKVQLTHALPLFMLISSALAGECRVPALQISSDIPNLPPTSITLIANDRTMALSQFEVNAGGKVSRLSASSLATLFKVINTTEPEDPLLFQVDNPTPKIEQISVRTGKRELAVDLNIDGAPEVTALKLSGDFSPTQGGSFLLDAYRSPNPFSSRSKITLQLKRSGNSCNDWRFHVADGEKTRPIAGVYLKGNSVFGAVIGVDEIVPVDFDPNTLQKVIAQLTKPAESTENHRVSSRFSKPSGALAGSPQIQNKRPSQSESRAAI